ncbi:lipoate--protein ligase family protein [Synechococcus sp. CCY9201]|uniref:lipoate--protein ligase family protein n=1 Tax=unclassified Synechococcus TaxID=2626047 RepID=UPI002AD2906A|nr:MULTISPECIES: lipoate--protein ligase family protein [unclassified Synechococcus]MEA5424116.1 lipoate--protein ligase family protein [Synechococcus sp. CCY9202]MEA5475601.1 lipoate--protein ligase family protein [Synechococcus sp. CCY9201]CAK6692138.1 Octanoyltransferase LipM [Synechococcus sp. CBW1107]
MDGSQHPVRDGSTAQVWRLLPDSALTGTWQMAIDEWMLDQGQPALRLYRWSRPTLSLGYHQRRLPPHWLALAADGLIDLVRRPTGGRAVLHGCGDLTYALIWPDPPGQRLEAYRLACRWLQHAFAALGLPLQFGNEPSGSQGAHAPNCFASATAADLVDAAGFKRIGSAQLWRRGQLLQHGAILVTPEPELWRQIFGEPPPPPPAGRLSSTLGVEDPHHPLRQQLLTAARSALPGAPVVLQPQPLSDTEWNAVEGRLQRYREGLTLTSPEATIERAT